MKTSQFVPCAVLGCATFGLSQAAPVGRFADVEGSKLYYEECGSGADAVDVRNVRRRRCTSTRHRCAKMTRAKHHAGKIR
jgi:hypothetical protein